MKLTYMASVATFASLAGARTFTVKNNCAFTVWPAIFTDLNVGSAVPSHATGWEAPPHTSVSFFVPDKWQAGRIWGRRECDFSNPDPAKQCVTGGCSGGLICDPHIGIGATPATVAEFTLRAGDKVDYYDVSLVDGYNLPVQIDNDKGCHVASCPVDLAASCPEPLRGPLDPRGLNLGCKSACAANVDGHPTDSGNCCSGSHSTPDKCPPSGVAYYSYFKGHCPNAYAYAYDESSGTALFTCDSDLGANYKITFCP